MSDQREVVRSLWNQRQPTQAEDIAEYSREYATLGRDFHQDMTLVEYCGLRLRNRPREPQRGGTAATGA